MSVKTEGLSFSYGEREVLKNVSFKAGYGEFVSVLGPNGAGKSTLFRCMLGLLRPAKGRTLIDGQDIADLNAAELARRVAYIPQSHSPVFNYSVLDTVLMGTAARLGRFSSPGKEQVDFAEDVLGRLHIADLRHRGYRSISGGERQLVLIARAMAQDAKNLIMDEPSSSLDFGNRVRVMDAVKGLTEQGYCVIQSTHDPEQVYRYSDKILALYGGEVLASGTPGETVRGDVMSRLYGVGVEVFSLRDDSVRVCLPAECRKEEEPV